MTAVFLYMGQIIWIKHWISTLAKNNSSRWVLKAKDRILWQILGKSFEANPTVDR